MSDEPMEKKKLSTLSFMTIVAVLIVVVFVVILLIVPSEPPLYNNDFEYSDVGASVEVTEWYDFFRFEATLYIEWRFHDSAGYDIECGLNNKTLYTTHINLEYEKIPSHADNYLLTTIDSSPGNYYISITNRELNITETHTFVLTEG